ncbi:MAG: diaminopimelate epimerase, partial [Acidimicrobiales bacterium]|nr:diaminopimelate epimerase [Acidimicrobiales bacterium]
MSEELLLYKYHGLGNDFLIHDASKRSISGVQAQKLLDRNRGVGGDGLLNLVRTSSNDKLIMELFNADGSVAEMSGNGLRCFAHCAHLLGFRGTEAFQVTTGAGKRQVQVIKNQENELNVTVDEEMGSVLVHGADRAIEAIVEETLTSFVLDSWLVDVGNPHLVVFVKNLEIFNDSYLERIGSRLSTSMQSGVNVEFVVSQGETCEMVVYERGVGITQACGTGSVAIAAASRESERSGDVIS